MKPRLALILAMVQYIPEQTAFLFPGQGSQSLGMGKALASMYPEARNIFNQANELLGYDLAEICWTGPEEKLNDTIHTQPALLTHSFASLTVFQNIISHKLPVFVAGHSMGEITALIAASSINFEDGLILAHHRGRLMKESGEMNPGGMAAILGIERDRLTSICHQIQEMGYPVQVANDNCPGQIVISGSHQGVDIAIEKSQEAGAKKAIKLAVSIPAHSSLMIPAQHQFREIVENCKIAEPQIPIVGNVCHTEMTTKEAVKNDIISQLTSPVYWTDSVRYMIDRGVKTFIEFGSGAVLSGLIKRIDNQAQTINVGTPEDLSKFDAV